MREIPLSQGAVAKVDDEDYDWLIECKWCLHSCGYAMRNTSRKTGKHVSYMHREIMRRVVGELLSIKKQVDHIDGDKLNNQRENLRLVSKGQNQMNGKPQRGSTSQYKGVSWSNDRKKWVAQIKRAGKFHYIGRFESEDEAARAYDAKAKELFGEFAWLNFPVSSNGDG